MEINELPEGIRQSKYLSADELALIAACERIPTEKELFDMRPVPEVIEILDNFGHDFNLFEEEMYRLAQHQINERNEWFAFKLLMVVEYTRESLVPPPLLLN
jgi:hypothetical protein